VRVLVAGGSGFLGAPVVRRLVSQGADVHVMTAHPGRSGQRVRAIGATAVRGDVRDPATLSEAVAGADVVVQALTFPTFPVEKPRRRYTFEEFDHLGTARLVGAAERVGAMRYVFVSGAGATPDAPQPWTRAKWEGEEAVRRSGLQHAIVRPSWVYGPGDVALNRFLWFARHLPFVPVIGDGRQRLQPVFVDDVADVLARAVAPGGPEGTFEIGGPEVLEMNDIIRTAMDVMGKRRPLVHAPVWLTKAGAFFLQFLPRPFLSPEGVTFAVDDAVADTRALVEAFGVRLTPLREGLSTYLSP
jgi:nucleoside-diphosphate-sugar epimerase